jgi:sigma-E processing peptidase SpoIIGA
MGQTVYGDLLFLINFSMDFLCFYIVCRVRHRPLRLFRTAAASALGGAFAVAALFISCPDALALLIDLAWVVLICAIAIGGEGLVVNTLLYGGVSAILGGIMTALYSFFNRIWADRGYSAESDGLSVWSFALLAVAGALITLIGGRRMRMRIASVNAEVVVTTDRGSVSMRGFTDSGNLLTDPLCGRAVILCELDAVRSVFSEELCAVWENCTLAAASELAPELAAALRFIPADGALSGDRAVLAAVKPRSVKIICGEKSAEVDVLLAPQPRRLSAGEARAIIPAGLI